MIQNPLNLIFGTGVSAYIQKGFEEGTMMSYGAHNLFIEAIVAFGIVGTSLLIITVKYCGKKAKIIIGKTPTLMSSIPLIVYLGTCLTGGSFVYFKTSIILIALYIIAVAFGKKYD